MILVQHSVVGLCLLSAIVFASENNSGLPKTSREYNRLGNATGFVAGALIPIAIAVPEPFFKITATGIGVLMSGASSIAWLRAKDIDKQEKAKNNTTIWAIISTVGGVAFSTLLLLFFGSNKNK